MRQIPCVHPLSILFQVLLTWQLNLRVSSLVVPVGTWPRPLLTTSCCSLPLLLLKLNQTLSSSSIMSQRSAAHTCTSLTHFSLHLVAMRLDLWVNPHRAWNLFFSQNGVPPPSPGGAGGGDSLLSPPSVATLLDISLPGPPEEALAPGESQTHISDSIIELAINSAHYGMYMCFFLMHAYIKIQMSLKKKKNLSKTNFIGCLSATMKVRRRSSLPPSWALTTAPNCSPHLPQSVHQEAGSHHPAMTPSGTPVTHLTLHWDVFCVCLKARINIMHCHFHFVPAQRPYFSVSYFPSSQHGNSW